MGVAKCKRVLDIGVRRALGPDVPEPGGLIHEFHDERGVRRRELAEGQTVGGEYHPRNLPDEG